MNHQCPVCQKSGIPDYRTSAVTCPQCDSDLSPYHLLYEVSHKAPQKPRSSWILLLLPAVAATLVFAWLYLQSRSQIENQRSQMERDNAEAKLRIDSLRFSLEEKDSLIALGSAQPISPEVSFSYHIQEGDYPGKVAAMFYGDWRMYKKIESDNQLTRPYSFRKGQELTIKIDKR